MTDRNFPRASYHERRRIMIEYLKMKIAEQDWHGVADAAMDLRDMDAEERGRLSGVRGS